MAARRCHPAITKPRVRRDSAATTRLTMIVLVAASLNSLLRANCSHLTYDESPFLDSSSEDEELFPSADEPSPTPAAKTAARFGVPSVEQIQISDEFMLAYNKRTRSASWVLEYLTADGVRNRSGVDRTDFGFVEDPTVDRLFRAQNADYAGSGLDRGHLAAAANHRRDSAAMGATFSLSNVAPQVGDGFNRDKWCELEMYARALAYRNRGVHVCTGPAFRPELDPTDGNTYVRYRVIGDNHVAVPTHFFKVILLETTQGDFALETYLLPNASIADDRPVSDFLVELEEVERLVGMRIFEEAPRDKIIFVNHRPTAFASEAAIQQKAAEPKPPPPGNLFGRGGRRQTYSGQRPRYGQFRKRSPGGSAGDGPRPALRKRSATFERRCGASPQSGAPREPPPLGFVRRQASFKVSSPPKAMPDLGTRTGAQIPTFTVHTRDETCHKPLKRQESFKTQKPDIPVLGDLPQASLKRQGSFKNSKKPSFSKQKENVFEKGNFVKKDGTFVRKQTFGGDGAGGRIFAAGSTHFQASTFAVVEKNAALSQKAEESFEKAKAKMPNEKAKNDVTTVKRQNNGFPKVTRRPTAVA